MKEFTKEMLGKARAAKSAEELLTLAKDSNIEMTEEEANNYFVQLNTPNGELNDDELNNVAGGGCGGSAAPKPESEPLPCYYFVTEGQLMENRTVRYYLDHNLSGYNDHLCGNCKVSYKGYIHFLNNGAAYEIECYNCKTVGWGTFTGDPNRPWKRI